MNNTKEKAKELFNKFCSTRMYDDQAKQCTLIVVNEILNVLWHTHKNEEVWRYYLEVKTEIEKL